MVTGIKKHRTSLETGTGENDKKLSLAQNPNPLVELND
jgi:hypothetical protein